MHIRRLLPPLAALGCVMALFPTAKGFTLLGGSLDLTQRDFRIFNNFADPEANDNQVPDPDFPGATGAELAIWKGVAEWGSRLHGSGGTDPLQTDGIGSGQSNFDSFYVGETDVTGGPNGNIISVLPGISFLHAFVEIPITDGWRMRFSEDPETWHDGPGPALTGAEPFDIQGTACHEYGHALGLGHSPDPNSTMFAALVGTGVDLRSIESDDIAGVQFLYGAISPTKPGVDTYELNGNLVTLFGENFDPANNEVWFSQNIVGGDGTPVKVIGVPSIAGGTMIEVAIPSAAGPGNIAVKTPGDAFDRLSNPFPFDPTSEPTFQAPIYYGQGTPLGAGPAPGLLLENVPSVSNGSMDFVLPGGPLFGFGIVFSGPARTNLPISGGTLLVKGPYRRDAVFAYDFGAAAVTVPIPPGSMVGMSRYYQVFAADSGSSNIGFTRGLRVTWAP